MAAPAYRASTSGGGSAGASVVANKPTGTVSGDVLVASLYVETTAAITAPSGFSEVTNSPAAPTGNQFRLHVYTKVAGGSEPSSYTFSWTGSVWRDLIIEAYSGADNTTPVSVSANAVNNSATATSTQAPSVSATTGAADCTLILSQAWYAGAANFAPASGFTERLDTADDLEVCDKAQAVAGATGSITPGNPTSGGQGPWGLVLIALQPATGGATNVTTTTSLLTMTATMLDPTITLGVTHSPSVAALTLAQLDPSIKYDFVVTANLLPLTLAQLDPAIHFDFTVTANVLPMTLAELDPSIVFGSTVSASLLPLTLALLDPTITNNINVTAAASGLAMTAALLDPAISGSANFTAGVQVLTAALLDPSVIGNANVAGSLLTLTASLLDPVVSGGAVAAANGLTLTAALLDPSISGVSVFTANVLSLTAALLHPTVIVPGVFTTDLFIVTPYGALKVQLSG